MWHAWERESVYRLLLGKPEGKRPLVRPRRRWEDGIKMDLREVGWGVWSGFTWLRIGITGGLLWMRWWNFGFWPHEVSYYKMLFCDPYSSFTSSVHSQLTNKEWKLEVVVPIFEKDSSALVGYYGPTSVLNNSSKFLKYMNDHLSFYFKFKLHPNQQVF
jgi:hypothetical protein